jgi:hypothetical protein
LVRLHHGRLFLRLLAALADFELGFEDGDQRLVAFLLGEIADLQGQGGVEKGLAHACAFDP